MRLSSLKQLKNMEYFWRERKDLSYVIEPVNWSINWDGEYITSRLNDSGLCRARKVDSDLFVRDMIVHYGSKGTYFSRSKLSRIIPNMSRKILTWFHISPNDSALERLREEEGNFVFVHTSCNKTGKKLIEAGVAEEKLVVIPLGVDTELFETVNDASRMSMRLRLGIRDDVVCIGSFQKDGVGWGDGLEPKMVKGPDLFCDVVERLSELYPIHVLLTGPARGYVKRRLESIGISYTHYMLKDYLQIADYYKALDLYLVCSREEGGPKAIVEAMATGVPLITTDVGMASDVIIQGENGFIVEDGVGVDGITESASSVIDRFSSKGEINRYRKSASAHARKYDWSVIAGRYHTEMYSKILT